MSLNSIKYCKRCGKIFNYKVSLMCPQCIIQTDKDFIACRDYLYKNKHVTIKELSEATGVDEKIILLLLKEGRLNLNSVSDLRCEKCDKPITNGRFCEDCTFDMKGQLISAKNEIISSSGDVKAMDKKNRKESYGKGKSNSTERMHIVDRINDVKEK